MGTETLPDAVTVAAGLLIKSADFLTTNAALQGAFVGRNTSGVPTSAQSLGTALYPWGNVYSNAITIGGEVIDLSDITSPATRIVSGRSRAASGQPQFLQGNAAAASVKILATTTDLVLSINSTSTTITADITEVSLTTAPAANNTCTINDAAFTDQDESKYFGEIDGRIPYIPIDAVGSEISARVGQFISLKTDTSEILFGWLKSATELVNVFRGFYFDASLDPLVRETLIDGEVLTLLATGWIFIDDDGATVDVTYTTPVYAYTAPTSPVADDYWYDITNSTWKRYSGSAWVATDRIPLGLCALNTSYCIATRSFDFYSAFKEQNTMDCEVFSDSVIRTGYGTNKVHVYGTDLEMQKYPVEWDNTTDMSSGSVGNDTDYYLYISTSGQTIIDLERPYDRTTDLRGKYHPYNNWRYIAKAKTDGTADWISVIASSAFDRLSGNANWEAENLVIETASVSTVTCAYDKLVLTNRDGKTKTLYDGSHTFDMATHKQGAELASHWYQLHIDGSGKLAMVPDLTGTADGTAAGFLVDSANKFSDYSVFKGATVYNTTDSTNAEVSVSPTASGDNLAIDTDIFVDTEDYAIHLTDPVGLDSFASNVGAVYNDSGSDLDGLIQIDNMVSFAALTAVSGGSVTTYGNGETDLSSLIPITAKAIFGYSSDTRNGGATANVSIAGNVSGYGAQVNYLTGINSTTHVFTTAYRLQILETQKMYYKLGGAHSVDIFISSFQF